MRLRGSSSRRFALLAGVVLIALSLGGGTAAQAGTIPSLVRPLSGVGPGAAGQAHEVRSRSVRPNLAVLFGADGRPRGPRSLPAIRFELFPDVDLVGVVERVESPGLGRVWVGTVEGVAESSFFLGVVGDSMTLHVDSPRGVYEVISDASGRYRAVQIDQSRFVEHPAGWEPHLGDAPLRVTASGGATTLAKGGGSGGSTGSAGTTIDVLVVYTPAARSAAGGTSKMQSLIATAASETNKAYSNGGISLGVRIVNTTEVSYAEGRDMGRDLNWLSASSEVGALRDQYGADTVTLIAERTDYCGLADAIMATPSTAFNVVARACTTGNLSFAHELGHLQGARHDTYVDPGTNPFPYGHGWVNVAKKFRTIMGYNSACQAVRVSCTRIAYFSDPTRTYSGAALGQTGTAENARVLSETATTIAGFRATVAP